MQRFLIFALLIVAGAAAAFAQQSPFKNKGIERVMAQIVEAYDAENLGSLDAARLIRGRVRIVIGFMSSSSEEEPPDEVARFRSFGAAERWLKKRNQKYATSFGRAQAFTGCSKGACGFEQSSGILHNQLYLSEIRYGYRQGRPFIKTIYFLNSD
ncbi:MAG TPA: hypothetical protein VF599_13540 [Pyrinomonadaceae bacterium]|jgi:hypothetical protein